MFYLAFPDGEAGPPERIQFPPHSTVACFVRLYFCQPKIGSCFGKAAFSASVAMPETTVYEDNLHA